MKIFRKFLIGAMVVTGVITVDSCKKDYFNRPPKSSVAIGNFYQNTAEIQAGTAILYGAPWFGWNIHAGWCESDLSGGNLRSYSSDIIGFQDFSVHFESSDRVENAAWNSLYTVIGQANALINNLPTAVPATVAKSDVNNALGEAHLFRALAYFHLVREYGALPIVANSADDINNYQLPRNPVTDVYKFIVNDLLFAEANLAVKARGGTYSANARVSSGSASALLAKVYLYMNDYGNARKEAEKVINSGEFKLYGIDITSKAYADLFLTANNNNEESIIALQWAGGAPYGAGNGFQSTVAYNTTITGTGDGYGQAGPTFDLQDEFDPADLRRKPTFALQGDHYAEIDQSLGGWTFDYANGNSQGVRAAVKKYVVGTPADNGGVGAKQSTANNTYMMRYADVYLIEAEAVMAGAQQSTDPIALNAINIVRRRAGLAPLTVINRFYSVANPNLAKYGATPNANVPTMLIKDDILDERRREFAFENDFFFDLMRIDGFNATSHPMAIKLIEQQDRGTEDEVKQIRYGNQYITGLTDDKLLLPIPSTEVAADPKLNDAPVPYKF